MNPQIAALKSEIQSRPAKCGGTTLITIDGPAGSGKTTLAHDLASDIPDTKIIAMDDLYLGWADTLTDGFSRRILDIVKMIENLGLVRYRPYDWQLNKNGAIKQYPAPKFLILEGVGSGQAIIRRFISLALWIEVPPEIGLARVIQRDGEAVARYMPDFIAESEIHFKKEATKSHAEYRLRGLGIV